MSSSVSFISLWGGEWKMSTVFFFQEYISSFSVKFLSRELFQDRFLVSDVFDVIIAPLDQFWKAPRFSYADNRPF
jgi:hypothetical protein